MSRATDVLRQLQLSLQSNETPELQDQGLDELYGPGFLSHFGSFNQSRDDEIDVDNADQVDAEYVTNRPIPTPKGKKRGSNYVPFPATLAGESRLREQEDDEDEEGMPKKEPLKGKEPEDEADMAAAAAEKEAEDATGEELGGEEMTGDPGEIPDPEASGDEAGMEVGGEAGMDAAGDMGGDMGADMGAGGDMGAGMDTGMDTGMGMGEQEEEKTAGELGRIYELKKIYARLTSIESYLSNESSETLSEIRTYVSQSIELFEIISSNFNSYKDKLDDIIVMYYKFIKETYNQVRDYFKKESKESK